MRMDCSLQPIDDAVMPLHRKCSTDRCNAVLSKNHHDMVHVHSDTRKIIMK